MNAFGAVLLIVVWLAIAIFVVSLVVAFFLTLWTLWPPLAIGFGLFAAWVIAALLA